MAAVSAAVKLPCWKMSSTIGAASTMRPSVAGTFSASIRPIAEAIVDRILTMSDSAASRDNAGVDAAAIDTPKRPIGRYMMRTA